MSGQAANRTLFGSTVMRFLQLLAHRALDSRRSQLVSGQSLTDPLNNQAWSLAPGLPDQVS
jgi:hypothetical protein